MTILVESRAGYRVITLNRPERLNALTVEMAAALIEALEAALATLNRSKTDLFASAQVDAAAHHVEEMYTKASGLQAKMHDRMRGFVDEARSEYRTWIITEWTATIDSRFPMRR